MVKDPATASGARNEYTDVSVGRITDRIPRRRGLTFGVTVGVDGPAGEIIKLRFIRRYPPPGLRYPGTGETVTHEEVATECRAGRSLQTWFTFDARHEILSGTWSFEFWDGQTKLVQQEFVVDSTTEGLIRSFKACVAPIVRLARRIAGIASEETGQATASGELLAHNREPAIADVVREGEFVRRKEFVRNRDASLKDEALYDRALHEKALRDEALHAVLGLPVSTQIMASHWAGLETIPTYLVGGWQVRSSIGEILNELTRPESGPKALTSLDLSSGTYVPHVSDASLKKLARPTAVSALSPSCASA